MHMLYVVATVAALVRPLRYQCNTHCTLTHIHCYYYCYACYCNRPDHEQKLRHYQALQQQSKAVEREQNDLESKKQQLHSRKEKLVRAQREASSKKTANIDLTDLEEEVEALTEHITDLQQQLDTVQSKIAELKAELQPLHNAVKATEQTRAALKQRLNDHEEQYDDLERSENQSKTTVAKFKQLIQQIVEKCSTAEAAVEQKQTAADAMLVNVEAFMKRSRESNGGWDGVRIELAPGVTKDKLNKKIAAAVDRLQKDKQERNVEQSGTRYEVMTKLADAMALHNEKVKKIQKTEEHIQGAWDAFNLRKRRWRALQT
jgi:chromosome segregation ATPase